MASISRICCCRADQSEEYIPLSTVEGEKAQKIVAHRTSAASKVLYSVCGLFVVLIIVLVVVFYSPESFGEHGHTAHRYMNDFKDKAIQKAKELTGKNGVNEWPGHNATISTNKHPTHGPHHKPREHKHAKGEGDPNSSKLEQERLDGSHKRSPFDKDGDAHAKIHDVRGGSNQTLVEASSSSSPSSTPKAARRPSSSPAPSDQIDLNPVDPTATEPPASPSESPAPSSSSPSPSPSPSSTPSPSDQSPYKAPSSGGAATDERQFASEHITSQADIDEYLFLLRSRAHSTTDPGSAKSWLSSDSAESDSLPFTLEAQQFLWNHQHPTAGCTAPTVQYLVWRMPNQGIAFDLRSLSYALALAVQTKRVLLIDRGAGWFWVDQEVTPSSPEFFFAPISACTLKHAVPIIAPEAGRPLTEYAQTPSIYAPEFKFGIDGGVMSGHGLSDISLVPDLVRDLFGKHESDQQHMIDVHWWRAQASRYLFRKFDELFRIEFQAESSHIGVYGKPLFDHHQHQDASQLPVDHDGNILPAPASSLPAGTTALALLTRSVLIYIRRGVDQTHTRTEEHEEPHLNENLSLTKDYLPLAMAVRTLQPEMNTLFVVTNDPAVANEAAALQDWVVLLHQQPRFPQPAKQAIALAHTTPMIEAHNFVVNMIWSSQARHFICPREAHFCRLVDDLRQTADRRSASFVTPVAATSIKAAAVPVMDHFW